MVLQFGGFTTLPAPGAALKDFAAPFQLASLAPAALIEAGGCQAGLIAAAPLPAGLAQGC